jgi:Arc/MetJ family transcription regulator
MKMNENDKRKYVEQSQNVEEDFHQTIKIQIQKVTKETATLIALLEWAVRKTGTDSSEHKMIREFGTKFLNDLVRAARKLDVLLQ